VAALSRSGGAGSNNRKSSDGVYRVKQREKQSTRLAAKNLYVAKCGIISAAARLGDVESGA